MRKQHIIKLLAAHLMLATLLVACNTNTISEKNSVNQDDSKNYQSIPIVDKENTRYFSWHTDRIRYFDSLGDLADNSPIVVTGTCLEASTVYKLNNIYTLSQIEVQEVYKGNIVSGDTIWVIECGGRTTFGDYDANCMVDEKEFESSEDRLPDDYQIVIGMDGFYPLKQGESVLLFLGDTSGFLPDFNDTLYSVSGDTDGKLYAQEDGTYKKPSPSQTDNYIFEEGNLTITVAELQSIKKG